MVECIKELRAEFNPACLAQWEAFEEAQVFLFNPGTVPGARPQVPNVPTEG